MNKIVILVFSMLWIEAVNAQTVVPCNAKETCVVSLQLSMKNGLMEQ